jgi:hypothetical protein
MSRIYLGVICGLIFGGLDSAMMIPLSFPDKRAALLGAFIARFGLGFVICNVSSLAGLDCRVAPRNPLEPARRHHYESDGSNSCVGSDWRIDHWGNCCEVWLLIVRWLSRVRILTSRSPGGWPRSEDRFQPRRGCDSARHRGHPPDSNRWHAENSDRTRFIVWPRISRSAEFFPPFSETTENRRVHRLSQQSNR